MKIIFSLIFSPLINKLRVPNNNTVQKVINLYKGTNFSGQFVKIRFWDSPYLEVEKMVKKRGKVVELGCGEGIFSNYIAIKSSKRQVLGIDLDRDRIIEADRGLKNTKFKFGDARKVKLEQVDSIILFHLLHHIKSNKDQAVVIRNCAESLRKGGQLIIVEVNMKFSFKYLVSWAVDCFVVPILFEGGFFNPVRYQKKDKWEQIIKSEGLKLRSHVLEKNMPFTHIVFEAYKLKN